MKIAIIPARGGSKRIQGKNLRMLAGHPLVAYAIASAHNCGLFNGGVYVSTEDDNIADVSRRYGAYVIDRPCAFSGDASPDIEWVRHALEFVSGDEFVIVRPTNPFRTSHTIRELLTRYRPCACWDSVRAVSLAHQHPHKTWTISKSGVLCRYLAPWEAHGTLECDQPTQNLDRVYIQNGCLQMFRRETVEHYGNYTGLVVMPFILEGYEAIDLNTELDWLLVEAIIKEGPFSKDGQGLEPIP